MATTAPSLTELVAALRRELQAQPEVRSAWLFGSRASGRARSDSDLDVAVWLGRDASFSWVADTASRLEHATGLPVDLIILDRASPFLAATAVRGLSLLCRDGRAELEYVLETSREAEDWATFTASFLEERWRSRATQEAAP